jgi:hypothetical protein
MEVFSLRKIHRICPQHRGPGPPAPAHGSTHFIKCRPLATRSTSQIKPIELVSRLLISVDHHRSDSWDGWLWPWAAPARSRGGASWLSVVARQSLSFLELRCSVFNEVCSSDEGNMFMLTLICGEQQRSLATVRQLGRCLSMVRVASCEDSTPRTCTKDSSSSLLDSRPTNCSDRWWKLKFGGYLGFSGFLTCGQKFALYAALYI